MTRIPLAFAEFRAPLNSGASTSRAAVFLPEWGVVEVDGDLVPLTNVSRMHAAEVIPEINAPVAMGASAARAARSRTSTP